MVIIHQIDSEEQLIIVFERVVRKVLKESAYGVPQPPGDELLTIQEAAALLHLSVPTVYGLNHRSLLPGVCKKGKRLYFLKQGILDYIKSGQKQTVEELTASAVDRFRKANNGK
ncbi:MAG TPA: helix-turn-helix domain-containing protein [Bacteroidia bacterium]|jgi:hypothetical protein|nr:helix-turn-helix domain-containing protein [Bacteroidia bacterium]